MSAPHLESGQGAQGLAQYLRQHPGASLQQVDELAGSFDLPPDFVRDVLKGVQSVPREQRVSTKGSSLRVFARAGNGAVDLFTRITANPYLFVGGTILLALAIFQFLPAITVTRVGGNIAGFMLNGTAAWTFITLTVLHMLCYYRHARSRVPLHGALMAWLLTTPPLLITMWSAFGADKEGILAPMLTSSAVALLTPWGFYAVIGMFASVIGGYVRMRRFDRSDRQMTRQQLLERLFEIQEQLSTPPAAVDNAAPRFIEKLRRVFTARPWLMAALCGFLANFFKVLAIAGGQALASESNAYLPLLASSVAIFFGLYTLALLAVGYFAGSLWRAAGLGLVFVTFAFSAELLPIGPFGPHIAKLWVTSGGIAIWVNVVQAVAVAFFACLGATIEERARKEERLRRQEPAALLAEMVRIQWRLTPTTSNVCIMVVDAARSADMKASADPLEVEYSFREYQNLISAVGERNGGEVHNTMGDGAVVAFKSCSDAYRGARELQTLVDQFNRDVNRLKTPFRLRVGLHTGPIAGDLNKVEFTEVIDIAAHVQAAAPVGGIAVTEMVMPYVSEHQFAQLQGTIDGCRVFIAMNPMLDG